MFHSSYDLTVHPLRFSAQALDPLALDQYAGSSLRGALFTSLLHRFCMNPAASTCADCPLNATCPVAELVAPLRDEYPRGRDIPRPLVIESPDPVTDAAAEMVSSSTRRASPMARSTRLSPGQAFTFGVTLIGTAVRLLPYVVMAAQQMGAAGMGRPMRANSGRRGRFTIEQIALANPFCDVEQILYHRGDQRVSAPTLAVTPDAVAARAASLPADTLTVEFLTPARLIASDQLVRRPDLAVLVARLAERLDALSRQYGDHRDDSDAASDTWNTHAARLRTRSLVAQVATAFLTADNTHWVDLASYSARQRRATPIGGFVGTATFFVPTGFSATLRELLVWGELLHVGKNAVKGDGRYRIHIPEDSRTCPT